MLEILIIVFLLAADQAAKYLTVEYLKPVGSTPLINGFLKLTYVENRGAAFGILQNQKWLLIVLPVIIAAVIAVHLYKNRKAMLLQRISLAVILAGAAGNLVDRIFRGYVVDMLEAAFIDFPVFNIADSAVVCGTILLAYQLLFLERDQSDGR